MAEIWHLYLGRHGNKAAVLQLGFGDGEDSADFKPDHGVVRWLQYDAAPEPKEVTAAFKTASNPMDSVRK